MQSNRLALVFFFAFSGAPWAASAQQQQARPIAAPLFFIENRGQADAQYRYYLQGGDRTFAFTPSGVRVGQPDGGAAFDWEFVDANPAARLTGEGKLPGVVNYYLGAAPEHHRAGVPTYSRVRYEDLWPGIDLIYTAEPARMKYELRVSPGADPARIRFRYRGSEARVAEDGSLLVGGTMRDSKPVSWQDDGRRKVSSAWRVIAPGEAGFELGEYDRGRELVIDPAILVRSMAFGSAAGSDVARNVAVDAGGNAYVAGRLVGAVPTVVSATAPVGQDDAFAAKFSASGVLQYLTYMGTAGYDDAFTVAVDPAGNAYVAGVTGLNFPTLSTSLNTASTTNTGFLVRLAGNGAAVSSSTIADTRIYAITVNASGDVFATGESGSFPVTTGVSTYGAADAFLAQIKTTGTALITQARVIGGSGRDHGAAIALDASGDIYVGGGTKSGNFPGLSATPSGFIGFVQKYAAGNLAAPVFSTTLYSSGTTASSVNSIAVDAAGGVYVAGDAQGTSFWMTPNAAFNTGSIYSQSYLTKIDATGAFQFLDFFQTFGPRVVLDSQQRVGLLLSGSLGFTAGGVTFPGTRAMLFLLLDAAGDKIICWQAFTALSTLGGGLAVSPMDSFWAVGFTDSVNYPLVAASAPFNQPSYPGQAIVAEIRCADECAKPPSDLTAWFPLEPLSGGAQTANIVSNVNATVNGTKAWGSFAVGQSLTFDGTSTYVAAANTPDVDITTTDFSFDFWMRIDPAKLAPPTADFPILDKLPAGASSGYRLFVRNRRLVLRLCVGGSCTDFTPGVQMTNDSLPHFYAVTVRRNVPLAGVRFYLDGNPFVASGIATSASLSNSASLSIGRAGTLYFVGDLDEIEIFKKELTAAEVKAIFDSGALGKCPLPVCNEPDLSAGVRALQNGANVDLAIPLSNAGKSAVSNFQYEVFLSSGSGCSNPVATLGLYTYSGTLAAGQSVAVNHTAALPVGAGNYNVCVRMDPNSRVRECDEANNITSVPLTVTAACALPDFSVTNVSVNPAPANAGGAVMVNYTVHNAGLGYPGTPGGTVTIYFATSPTATTGLATVSFQLPALPPGSTSLSRAIALPVTMPGGTYYAIVRVDSGATVPECDERNNNGASPAVRVNEPRRIDFDDTGFETGDPTSTTCTGRYCVSIGEQHNRCLNIDVAMSVPGNIDVYARIGRPVALNPAGAAASNEDRLDLLGRTRFDPSLILHDVRATGDGPTKRLRLSISPEQFERGEARVYLGYVTRRAEAGGTIEARATACPDDQCPLVGGEVAHYKLESPTDPIVDSVSGLNGEVQTIAFSNNYGPGGTLNTIANGKAGAALHFDNKVVVRLPVDPKFDIGPNGITVTAWVKLSPADAKPPFLFSRTIFSRRSSVDSNHVWAFSLGDSGGGDLYPRLGVHDGNQGTGTPRGGGQWDGYGVRVPFDDQWHCVGMRLTRKAADDSVDVVFMVDGKVVGANPASPPAAMNLASLNTGYSWIGWSGLTPSNFDTHFVGGLDEVRVYSRGLTEAELQSQCANCSGTPITVTLNTSPVLPASGGYSVTVDDQTAPTSGATGPQTASDSGVTSGDTVELDAPLVWSDAGAYYQLINYTSGSYTGTPGPGSSTVTVKPTASITYTANYEPLCYVVTINWTPLAGGSASLNPSTGGIANPPGIPPNCYAPGTVLTIVATPASGNQTGTATATTGLTVAGNQVTVTAPGKVTVPFRPIPPPCATPPTGMTGWFPLDETAGPSRDIAGPIFTPATWVGSPTPVSFMVGGALRFGSGASAAHVVASNSGQFDISGTQFSLDAWIRTTASGNAMPVVEKRDLTPNNRGYMLFLNAGRLAIQLNDGTFFNYISPAAAPAINDGRPHHVAATLDRTSSTGLRLYVDGTLVATFNPQNRPGSMVSSQPMRIGFSAVDRNGFNGDIDEVEIFDRAITANEIVAIFRAGAEGKCRPATNATVTVTGCGRVTGNGPGPTFPIGAVVQLNPTASTGSVVTATVTMGGNTTVYTTFPASVTLTADATVVFSCVDKPTACVTPPSGMVGWYAMDDTTATMNDRAPGPPPAPLTPARPGASPGAPGKVGTAWQFLFGGVTSSGSPAKYNFGTGDFSLDGWLRFTGGDPAPILAMKMLTTAGAQQGFMVRLDNGVLRLDLASGGTVRSWIGTKQIMLDKAWHHWTVTVSRTSGVTFIVDGAVDPLTANPAMITGTLDNSQPFQISGVELIQDEVEIFNRVLTVAEAQLLYLADSLGKCKTF